MLETSNPVFLCFFFFFFFFFFFWEKKKEKNIINVWAADIAQTVVKVIDYYLSICKHILLVLIKRICSLSSGSEN